MPTYTFKNKNTEEVKTLMLTIKEREEYLAANPHIQQIITNPNGFISAHAQKPHDGFRDMLREMKKVNKGSTIETF